MRPVLCRFLMVVFLTCAAASNACAAEPDGFDTGGFSAAVGSTRPGVIAGAADNRSATRCAGARVDLSELGELLNSSAVVEQMGRSYLLLKHNRVKEIDCAYGNGTLSSETRIPWASSTKALTGTLFRILEQEGYLDLDASPYTLDPDPVWLESEWPQVTLRQLLTHTSGAWVSEEEELAEWRYCDIELSEAVRRIREHGFEPAQTPGGQFHYSSTGLQIAAHLVSQALGTNFVDLMEWYLFDRLGMESAIMWCPRNPAAGGGASSSAADYMRFLEIFLSRSPGARLVFGSSAAPAVRDMISNQIGSLPVVYSPYADLIGDRAAEIGYGLGVWIEVADRRDRAIRLTAPGHRGTVPWADRSCGVAAILIAEDDGVELQNIYPVYLQILDILNRKLGCSAPG